MAFSVDVDKTWDDGSDMDLDVEWGSLLSPLTFPSEDLYDDGDVGIDVGGGGSSSSNVVFSMDAGGEDDGA